LEPEGGRSAADGRQGSMKLEDAASNMLPYLGGRGEESSRHRAARV
jgi:hypothetical protein